VGEGVFRDLLAENLLTDRAQFAKVATFARPDDKTVVMAISQGYYLPNMVKLLLLCFLFL
jgi:hypothetical protein